MDRQRLTPSGVEESSPGARDSNPPKEGLGSRPASEERQYARTPLFEASHAARYERQSLIRRIQQRTGLRLICYVSAEDGAVTHDDVVPFMDLLHNVPPDSGIELLLHTGGGDIDTAEKLISMVRQKVGESKFRIVVPDFAMSAGTLMVLGADRVVMSDSSSLGPIDPQILTPDNRGVMRWMPAQNFLDAFDVHSKTLSKDPNNLPARIMLGKLDPAILRQCESARQRAQRLAESQLNQGMFRGGTGNTTGTASELLDTTRWQSHSQTISWQDAIAPPLELKVEYVEPQSEIWQEYWKLYCRQRLEVRGEQILYESDFVSMVIGNNT